MAVNTVPIYPNDPVIGVVQIANADASGLKTVLTGDADGTKIVGLTLASDDTSARDVQWGITRSGTFYPCGTVTVAIGAGTLASTPAVNAFSPTNCPGLPVDENGNPFIILSDASDTLQIKSLTTVTSGKLISAKAVAGHF